MLDGTIYFQGELRVFEEFIEPDFAEDLYAHVDLNDSTVEID
jgi:hypothetical protein